ncbi:ArsR/SmtB family transcription factor [Planctomonas psychrotolerans]|uniref:ArsR/SmtB family transcription factor n=1 Tax=Planctomonas psychrotolerans TaxID=2528712 RepID=UPI00123C1C63|nr:metalloregulator ArsR/SmtB family transcription factor [Planctomonas psychrotolerans]
MVVGERFDSELSAADVDRVFQALADATRRDIVDRVLQREASVTELAERYTMSFAAVQKHVAVLERASLVTKVRSGREQLVHGNPDMLRLVTRLLDRYEDLWRRRTAAIEDILAEDPPSAPPAPTLAQSVEDTPPPQK